VHELHILHNKNILINLNKPLSATVQQQQSVHLDTGHQSETVRLPLQVHERGTVYRQPYAQHPHRFLPSKKELKSFLFGFSFWS